MKSFKISSLHVSSLLAATLLLAACNNDTGSTTLPGGDDHDHDHEHTGRLVFTEANGSNSRVYVYDLTERASIADFALTYPATAVHASPEARYALLVQRDNDQVELLDSGISRHEDHVHTDDPAMLGFILTGVRPTHYRINGEQAALFYDGDAGAANLSRFQLLTDESLTAGGVVAGQTLDTAHHGIAEPLGELVLASHSPANGDPADGITVYELHGDHFHDEGSLATACPGLHGGASNGAFSAFGCEDGVLLAELHGDHFHEAKVTVSERIALVLGRPDLPRFAAFAYPGYNLYAIDPETATAEEIDWRDGATDGDGDPVEAIQYGLDPHGEHLLILDNTGHLHVLDTTDWQRETRLHLLDSVPPSGGTSPVLAFSGAGDLVFITDPAERAIRVLDLETLGLLDEAIELDFAPVGLAWTGPAESDHDHDDEDHDHEH